MAPPTLPASDNYTGDPVTPSGLDMPDAGISSVTVDASDVTGNAPGGGAMPFASGPSPVDLGIDKGGHGTPAAGGAAGVGSVSSPGHGGGGGGGGGGGSGK